MRCRCGSDSRCVDSRPTGRKDAIRRRRECLDCGERFTTYELREDDLTCLPLPEHEAILRDRNRAIRELCEGDCTQAEVADAFGLSSRYVSQIVNRAEP